MSVLRAWHSLVQWVLKALGEWWSLIPDPTHPNRGPGPSVIWIGPLWILIHARESEMASDYWDGNWLVTTVGCTQDASGARIENDPFLRTEDLIRFRNQCVELERSREGRASLGCMDPYLDVEFQWLTSPDRIDVKASIQLPPDWEPQPIRLEFRTEDLPDLIADLDAALTRFPLRGRPDAGPTPELIPRG